MTTLVMPSSVQAHAVAGMPVLPATMSFDAPGVANELGVNDGRIRADSLTTNTPSLTYSKSITRRFGLSVASDYNWLNQPGAPNQADWDDLSVDAPYQPFINGPHEVIGMLALGDRLWSVRRLPVERQHLIAGPEIQQRSQGQARP